MRWQTVCVLAGQAIIGYLVLAFPGATQAMASERKLSWEAAQSAASKLRQVREGAYPGHSFGSVRISEVEANSYLHYQMASYFPPGVSKARLKFQPEHPQGSAEVDFDRVKETFGSPANPLVDYLLRGVHTLEVEGILSSADGIAQFHLETVTLDDMTLPRPVVDFLIEHYLKAYYPTVAIDRPFRLPFSIDKVDVEEGSLVLVGRPADRF